jgi:hypothetical protein
MVLYLSLIWPGQADGLSPRYYLRPTCLWNYLFLQHCWMVLFSGCCRFVDLGMEFLVVYGSWPNGVCWWWIVILNECFAWLWLVEMLDFVVGRFDDFTWVLNRVTELGFLFERCLAIIWNRFYMIEVPLGFEWSID